MACPCKWYQHSRNLEKIFSFTEIGWKLTPAQDVHAQFIVLIAFDQEEEKSNFFDFAAKAGITGPNEKKLKSIPVLPTLAQI